eukprot:tig00000444_g803.t1
MEYSGSSYEGQTVNGRIEGQGTYTFPSGIVYTGEFKDGMFHGKGVLSFPGLGKYSAVWNHGIAVEGQYTFSDGLQYQEADWGYLTPEDRRFFSELCNGIKPAGQSQLSNADTPPQIPPGTYDTGEGYFELETGKLFDYTGRYLRMPQPEEIRWILSQCRVGL